MAEADSAHFHQKIARSQQNDVNVDDSDPVTYDHADDFEADPDHFSRQQEEEEGQDDEQSEYERANSFVSAEYKSHEMKKLLSLSEPEEKIAPGLSDVSYKAPNVFPDWVLGNPLWKVIPKIGDSGNAVSDILKIQASKRNADQLASLVHWLMSVWKVASTMGFKRCQRMFNEFRYTMHEVDENIIVEGERGLKMYIIVSGTTHVFKEGIGKVGELGKGKSFGEIALTQGKDLRTATVTAVTKVETLSLHKLDYEFFVRDIQEGEKRENFTLLMHCKLFKGWPKAKIEKMANTCQRKVFETAEYIFHQGDTADNLYVVIEGSVKIIKELVIVSRNRWPVGKDGHGERVTKLNKPVQLTTLNRGDYFGEVAIIKKIPRSTSALTTDRTTILCLDKAEFLHLISYGNSQFKSSDSDEIMSIESINQYIGDKAVLDTVKHLKGGPGSEAVVGSLHKTKAKVEFDDSHRSAEEKKRLKSVNDRQTKALKKKVLKKNKAAHEALVYAAAHNQHPGSEHGHNSSNHNHNHNQEQHNQQQQHHHHTGSSAQHHDDIIGSMKKIASNKLETEKSRVASCAKLSSSIQSSTSNESWGTSNRRSSNVGFSNLYNRRGSLQVDNDPSYIFDSRTILRKNTAVNLNNVYEEYYRSHTSSNGNRSASPSTNGRQRRQSSVLSPNIKGGGRGRGGGSWGSAAMSSPNGGGGYAGVVGIMTNSGPDMNGFSNARRGSTRFLPKEAAAAPTEGWESGDGRGGSPSCTKSRTNHEQPHSEGAVTIYPGMMDANMRRCSSAGINPVSTLFSPMSKHRDMLSHRKAMHGITAADVQQQLQKMGYSEDPNHQQDTKQQNQQQQNQDQDHGGSTKGVYSSLPQPLPTHPSPQHRARSAGSVQSRNDLPRMSTASYGNDLGYGFRDMAKRPSQRRRTPSTLANKSKISYAELMSAM